MPNYAILYGGKPGILEGVDNNLAALETALRCAHGFQIVGKHPRATRALLLESLAEFVENLEADDVAVVYFTGHGGLVRFAGEVAPEIRESHVWRYLEPADPEHSRRDFRGVLDVELYELLGDRAKGKGASVTLILESCFAGGMIKPFDVLTGSRDLSQHIAEGVPAPAGLLELAGRYRARAGNDAPPRDLIVVSATSEARPGYELHKHGVFTANLCRLLEAYRGTPVSWGRLVEELAIVVQEQKGLSEQFPVLIGPPRREVFGLRELADDSGYVARDGRGELWMFGGMLHGFAAGDRVALRDVDEQVAEARLVEVQLDRAKLELESGALAPERRHGAVLREPAWRMPVAIGPGVPDAEALRAALSKSDWVRPVEPGADARAKIVDARGRASVAFPDTARVLRSELDGERRVNWILADLEDLARSEWLAQTLAELPAPPKQVESWVLVNGTHELVPDRVETLRVGRDRINCGLRYAAETNKNTLFVNILNRQVDGHFSLISANVYAPGGFNLFSEVPGPDREGQERAVRSRWCDDVPHQPLPEELWFVFSSRPVNLGGLLEPRGPGRSTQAEDLGGQRVLENLLRPLECYVRRYQFMLEPGEARPRSAGVASAPEPTPGPAAPRGEPRRRALLLGAEAPDLRGVATDLELMREALGRHGFADADIRAVRPATRDAILSALERLIEDSEADDVALIYYSGHGTELQRPPSYPRAIDEVSFFRMLVPCDFEQSTAEDFRGIATIELSCLLERLTDKTQNVVAIMDCCFAGTLYRAEQQRAKLRWQVPGAGPVERALSLTPEFHEYATKHFDRVSAAHGPDRRHPEANPHVVQLLASSATGQAFELPDRSGQGHAGAMTGALHRYLLAADPRVTWQELGRALRADARGWVRKQEVAIEGPYRRYLFRIVEREELGAVEVLNSSEGPVLLGGRLAGIAPGDLYEIVGQRVVSGALQTRVLGSVSVGVSYDSYALADEELELEPDDAGWWARPIGAQPIRASVELHNVPEGPGRRLLEARFASMGLIELADPGRTNFPIIGRIEQADGRVRLYGRELAFDAARTFDVETAPRTTGLLAEHLARNAAKLFRARRLLTLADTLSAGAGNLERCWTLSWARVTASGELEPLEPGDVVNDGESVTVQIREAQRALFASVFWCRPDAGIDQLSLAQAGGVEIVAEGEGYALGQRSGGPIRGYPLACPSASVVEPTRDGRLPSALIAIVSERPVDLRAWRQPGIARFIAQDPIKPGSGFRAISQAPPAPEIACYRIARLDFDLRRPG